jgi:adenine phosphoribosyltransferase
VIAGLDARGFIFATLVAQILDRPLVMIRKTGKLPGNTVDEAYDLEYGSNSISVQEGSILPGQRVALIDDLLATGGTMQAAARLVERVGGVVDSVLYVIALDEPFLVSQLARKHIEARYNTKSILHY